MKELKNILSLSDAEIIISITAKDLEDFATSLVNKAIDAIKNESDKKPIWLTPDQVSSRLGVDKSTLWRWNKEGYLKGEKFGNRLRYRESDVLIVESAERGRKS